MFNLLSRRLGGFRTRAIATAKRTLARLAPPGTLPTSLRRRYGHAARRRERETVKTIADPCALDAGPRETQALDGGGSAACRPLAGLAKD